MEKDHPGTTAHPYSACSSLDRSQIKPARSKSQQIVLMFTGRSILNAGLISVVFSLLVRLNSCAQHWTKWTNLSQTTVTFQKDWRRWSLLVEWHRLRNPLADLPDPFIIRLFPSVCSRAAFYNLNYVAPVENTKNVPFLWGFFLQMPSKDLKWRAVDAEMERMGQAERPGQKTSLHAVSAQPVLLPLINILPCLCHVGDTYVSLSWKDEIF